MALTPPLFVEADEPLFIFGDEETARLGVEFWDVRGEPWQGFDAEGCPFRLEGAERGRKWLGLIPYMEGDVVVTPDDGPPRPAELRRLLSNALIAVGAIAAPDADALSLDELKQAAIDKFGIE